MAAGVGVASGGNGHLGVNLGRIEPGVAEHLLDETNVAVYCSPGNLSGLGA